MADSVELGGGGVIQGIQILSPKPGDILVVTLNDATEEEMESLEILLSNLKKSRHDTIDIILVPGGHMKIDKMRSDELPPEIRKIRFPRRQDGEENNQDNQD